MELLMETRLTRKAAGFYVFENHVTLFSRHERCYETRLENELRKLAPSPYEVEQNTAYSTYPWWKPPNIVILKEEEAIKSYNELVQTAKAYPDDYNIGVGYYETSLISPGCHLYCNSCCFHYNLL